MAVDDRVRPVVSPVDDRSRSPCRSWRSAASLLIAVSAGVSYLAAGRSDRSRPVPQETPIQAMAEPLMPPSADVTPANFADAQFDEAVADLEQILVDQRESSTRGRSS